MITLHILSADSSHSKKLKKHPARKKPNHETSNQQQNKETPNQKKPQTPNMLHF